MSEEINKIFEQWKQFLSWCYENNDKTTEIHRDNLEKVMEYTEKLQNQLQQKENIIKEAREKVNTIQFEVRSNDKKYSNLYITLKSTLQGQELLEILDKGSDKE